MNLSRLKKRRKVFYSYELDHDPAQGDTRCGVIVAEGWNPVTPFVASYVTPNGLAQGEWHAGYHRVTIDQALEELWKMVSQMETPDRERIVKHNEVPATA